MLELLKALSALPGVSGDEGRVREALIAQINNHCAEYRVDALGNLLVFKPGHMKPKNKIQFSAHMDEVGFIITHIEKDGLLRFAAVGGIEPDVAIGKQVRVGDKQHTGVIGLKPIHFLTEDKRSTMPKLDSMAIDIGARDGDEAARHVSPGDRVVFQSEWLAFGDGMIKGRALDDRVGCALLADFLCHGTLAYDCWCTFTVQEETGCVGAKTAAYALRPDIAVAVEATTAGDIDGAPEEKKVCCLGGGPVLSFMDKGTVYSPELYHTALETAKGKGIACQSKQGVYGGNESRSLQTAGEGAKVLAVSVPCRYLHSPSCVVKASDIDETARLLPILLERFADL